jgi:ankyrin repeat protein
MVQSLLNKGADVNCRQDDLRTPLHLAAYYGELKVARVLVEHKADVNSQDKEGKTPLHYCLKTPVVTMTIFSTFAVITGAWH